MEVTGKQTIDQSPDPLWDMLLDAGTLEQTIPGAQDLGQDGTHYEGTLERGLAGISITLSASVDITDQARPKWIACDIEGTDNTINSRVDGEAHVDFEENGDGGTELVYQVEFDFSGKLASLGSRIIKRKVNNDIDTFFENLSEYVDEQEATT